MEKEESLKKRKVEVVGKDISEEICSAVVDICMEVKDMKEFKKNAKKIRDMLESKFEKEWNVIVGESFSGNCTVAEGYYLEIRIDTVFILVFKSHEVVKG